MFHLHSTVFKSCADGSQLHPVHNNFYFLRQITESLTSRLAGKAVISECFSQSKDELVIRWEVGSESFCIRANLSPALSCLSFPDRFERARKNSVDLMPTLIGTRVTYVRQFINERSFAVGLSGDQVVLFKMHGNRSNIILLQNNSVTDTFRKNLVADENMDPDSLDRVIDWSREFFDRHIEDLRRIYFTFGKVVWHYLEARGFSSLTTEQKWEEIQTVRQLLENPDYYIAEIDGKPHLCLLPVGDFRAIARQPVEAANEFYRYFTQQHVFLQEKKQLLVALRSQIAAGENYCLKNYARLEELMHDNPFKVWADVLMANLHAVDSRTERVVLENFYDDDKPIEIPLRKGSTPQKVAETYYRKAKNRHIEIERLQQSVARKEEELEAMRARLAEAESLTDLKAVRGMRRPVVAQKDLAPLPYHEYMFRDFRILVGKNAQANDILTLKHSYKDDLWLHAKDVSGSHVLIKYQAGRSFPADVIEYAASLAAFHSKRRSESLCPVIVTPKKFVRKRKGDPPGAVVVEREEVRMVEPHRG